MVTTQGVDRTYPAKLLMFGEYAILLSGAAIAIPFKTYKGHWTKSNNVTLPTWANDWLAYLQEHCTSFLDLSAIDAFLKNHIYESDIPIGAGIGSSGALTASLYDIGAIEKTVDLVLLQDRLALMESHFHGKSSGLDPLVSYLNQAVYQSTDKTVSVAPEVNLGSIKAYLLDSKRPREGKSFIQQFLTSAAAHQLPYQAYKTRSNKIIETLMSKEDITMEALMALSKCQYELMPDMIVDGVRECWKSGLDSRQYATKLCGAGGGGYYLVFSEEEMEQLGPYSLIKLQMP